MPLSLWNRKKPELRETTDSAQFSFCPSTKCRMTNRKIDIRHFSFASCNPKSAFDIRQFSIRGHSSVGRAPALQAGSQGFESPCLQSLQSVEATSYKREHFRITSGSVIPLPPKPAKRGGNVYK